VYQCLIVKLVAVLVSLDVKQAVRGDGVRGEDQQAQTP
jgi:hypothetical protein